MFHRLFNVSTVLLEKRSEDSHSGRQIFVEWRIKSSNTHENSSKLFSHRWKNEYFFSFHSRFPAHDSTTPSSRNLSQRRGTIVTYDTKRNDIYGFSVPLVSSSLCFHSIRNHSGIHRKAICRARHAHRERCMNVHTHTYTHAHGWATRPWKKNRIPRQTGTFRAVFASRPQQSPLSHCRTLHESYLLNTIKGSWHNICLRGRRA